MTPAAHVPWASMFIPGLVAVHAIPDAPAAHVSWVSMLILASGLILVLLPLAAVIILVVFYVRRSKRRSADAGPRPAAARPLAASSSCPQCGTPLPPDAPLGLCPRCVLKVGVDSQAQTQGPGVQPPGSPPKAAFVPPNVADLAPRFPNLEILELVGQGGMGAVYRARQPGLDRQVALKILPPGLGADPTFAERFTREARSLARLNHPNIVTVHDFGQTGDLFYFVMEYVDGVSLRQLERAARLAPRDALAIVIQVCEALQFAHDAGIVHRDIKPENILIDRKGRAKIADFGLAKLLAKAPADFTLTRPEQVMGTPAYMAPEQLERPAEVDQRADIYSLGVVFYEMLTGELPLGRFLAPSQKVQVDVRLDEVVLKTLEKEPERRYQHASEVKTDVEQITGTPQGGAAPMAAQAAAQAAAGAGRQAAAGPAARRPGVAPPATGPARTSWLAVASLVCAVGAILVTPLAGIAAKIAWVFGLLFFLLSPLLLIVGLVLGIVAVVGIRRSGGRLRGTGYAVGGIVTSSAALVLGLMLAAVTLPAMWFVSSREVSHMQGAAAELGALRDVADAELRTRQPAPAETAQPPATFSDVRAVYQTFKEALRERQFRRLARLSNSPPSPWTEDKWRALLTSSGATAGAGGPAFKDLLDAMEPGGTSSVTLTGDKAEIVAAGVTFLFERHPDGAWYFHDFK